MKSSTQILYFSNSPSHRFDSEGTVDSLTATKYSDTACFDSGSVSCATSYEFYNVLSENFNFTNNNVEGLVGFGKSPTGMPNFVESLKAAGAIDSSTVTFTLNKDTT